MSVSFIVVKEFSNGEDELVAEGCTWSQAVEEAKKADKAAEYENVTIYQVETMVSEVTSNWRG